MGLEEQGARPKGLLGKIIGFLMNKFHTDLYAAYLSSNLPVQHAKILDIGCGGGKLIHTLLSTNDSYKLYGIDHSPEMIKMAGRVNRKFINQHRLNLFNCSVSDLPIGDNYLDLVTALETIQFWGDTDFAVSEIARILKPGGSFLIINRFPPEGSKWWKMAKLKSETDYLNCLLRNGFKAVSCNPNYKKGWIVVKGLKKKSSS